MIAKKATALLSSALTIRGRGLRIAAAVVLVGTPVFTGCFSDDEPLFVLSGDAYGACPPAPENGVVHGGATNQRLDLKVAEAWPKRRSEPSKLTPSEVARACAIYAACSNEGDALRGEDADFVGALALASCYNGSVGVLSTNAEQRAIPLVDHNERWSYFVRAVLETGGDCMEVQSALSQLDENIACEEDGCWWSGDRQPTVSCEGSVATLRHGVVVTQRDCARSYTECDPSSPTGCTDRPLLRCSSDALLDRCDGDVRLGCDRCGLVAFRDCSWNGGTCVETKEGAHCESPKDTCGDIQPGCDGTRYRTCVFGQAIDVDCAEFGMECVQSPSEEQTVSALAGARCVPASES